MSETPEQIWAWPEGMPIYCSGTNPTQRQAVEYIRADHVDALLKAEREKALREAADKLRIMGDMGGMAIVTALISEDKTDG